MLRDNWEVVGGLSISATYGRLTLSPLTTVLGIKFGDFLLGIEIMAKQLQIEQYFLLQGIGR